MELSSSVRRSCNSEETATNSRTDNVSGSVAAPLKRRILGEIYDSNKRFHQAHRETEVPKRKKVWAELLRTVYFLLLRLYSCAGGMESSVDGQLETCTVTAMESLATHTVLYTTLFKIQMVEELTSFRSSFQPQGNQTDSGWLPFIDIMVLLTTWSYLGPYPPEVKPLKPHAYSTTTMDQELTDMPMSFTSALGHPTTVGVDLSRESTSNEGQDQVDHGELCQNNTSSTSSCICCVTPGSCVYLKSEVPPSTSHLVQVSLFAVTCGMCTYI